MSKVIKLQDNWQTQKITMKDIVATKVLEDMEYNGWNKIGSIRDIAILVQDNLERKYVYYKHFENPNKLILSNDNMVPIPVHLLDQVGLKRGDELYIDIFDDELKQIVIGKKLSGDDAIKGLDKITSILE